MPESTVGSRVRRACLLAPLLAGLLQGAPALAQAFPSRPVRLVVPFPPGGGSDIQARMLADHLGAVWKQPVVVDNVSGAGGGIAASAVARAKADGYTILFATHPILSINPFLYRKLGYDAVADFAPVVKLADAPLVLLVPAASPIRSVADLVRAAREKPGAVNFGSGGIGTSQHLTGELLQQVAGIKLTHVPYRGNAQTTTALIANEVQMFFDNAQSAAGLIASGRARGIAVTSRRRLASMPDLPTVAETIPRFESSLAYGLLVPAATPAALVGAINRDVNKVLAEPDYAGRLQRDGLTVEGGTPGQFREFLAGERTRWGEVLKRLDVKLD